MIIGGWKDVPEEEYICHLYLDCDALSSVVAYNPDSMATCPLQDAPTVRYWSLIGQYVKVMVSHWSLLSDNNVSYSSFLVKLIRFQISMKRSD